MGVAIREGGRLRLSQRHEARSAWGRASNAASKMHPTISALGNQLASELVGTSTGRDEPRFLTLPLMHVARRDGRWKKLLGLEWVTSPWLQGSLDAVFESTDGLICSLFRDVAVIARQR